MAARRPGSLAKWQRDALRRIAATRKATLRFLPQLSEAEMLRPRTQDRWSVKDVLAHLMTCDEETVRRFRLIARGRGDRIHWFESMADADRFNARSVAGARRLSVAAVLRRMARAHAAVLASLRRLPPESLRDPSHAYPVTDWLPAPGWNHEREHLSEIKAWWRSARSTRSPR
jgi:DinB family protein